MTFVWAVFSPTASVEARAVVSTAGTAIDSPDVFRVAFTCVPAVVVLVNPVPAYPPAFREMPELLTVHVTLVWAVLSPMPSVDARAVVR